MLQLFENEGRLLLESRNSIKKVHIYRVTNIGHKSTKDVNFVNN